MAGRSKVRMLVGVSGSRHDGQPWPPAGGEVTVPAWEAEDLIRAQIAVDAGQADDEPEVPDPVPGESRPASQIEGEKLAAAQYAPAPVAPPEVSGVAEVYGAAEVPGVPAEPAEAAPEPVTAAEATAPAPSAPKQSWIDYAVSQGATPDEAATMTKADLMSRYGGRL